MRRILTSISRVSFIALVAALCAPLAFAQMPQGGGPQPLSSSEVSDAQIQKAATIMMDLRTEGQKMRMQLKQKMKQKYGNPQEMDSTKKAQMRKEMMQEQRKMRKQQMKMMQKKANQEGMEPQMFKRIMTSAQKDSTLKKRLTSAMKAQAKQRQSQMGGSGQQGGGSNR